MRKDFATKSYKFWNKKNTIQEFRVQPLSDYWVSFFKVIPSRAKKKVLDLGCGAGRNTKMLIKLGFDTFSCDKYKKMVEETRKQIKKFNKANSHKVLICDMSELPYQNSFFDLILCHGVFHNASSIKDFRKAVSECSRVLKPGGRLCFNFFTSKYIAEDFREINRVQKTFSTKEGLIMTLISVENFLSIAAQYDLSPQSKITEYKTKVSTGYRSVARGIFKKDQ